MSHLFQVQCFHHHDTRVRRPNAGDSTDSDATRRWSNTSRRHRSKYRGWIASHSTTNSSIPGDREIPIEDVEQSSWISYSYSEDSQPVASIMDACSLQTWVEEQKDDASSPLPGAHVPPYLQGLDTVCVGPQDDAKIRVSGNDVEELLESGTLNYGNEEYALIGFQRVSQMEPLRPSFVSGESKRREVNPPSPSLKIMPGAVMSSVKDERPKCYPELLGFPAEGHCIRTTSVKRSSKSMAFEGKRSMSKKSDNGAKHNKASISPSSGEGNRFRKVGPNADKDCKSILRNVIQSPKTTSFRDTTAFEQNLVSPDTFTSESEEDDLATLDTADNSSSGAKDSSTSKRCGGCPEWSKWIALLVVTLATVGVILTLVFLLRPQEGNSPVATTPNYVLADTPNPSPSAITSAPNIFHPATRRPRALAGLRPRLAPQVR